MKWIIVGIFLATASAFAHVEPGVYQGTTIEGKGCSMKAGETYFEKNTPHPLNERITITVDEKIFTVGHPPILSSRDAIVFFNHDLFQGILPTPTGAQALEIEMVHSEEFEGPRSFTFMENFWKTKRKESYKCNDIKLVK